MRVTGPCTEVPGFTNAVQGAIPEAARAASGHAEMQVSVQTKLEPTSSATIEVHDTILDAPAGKRELASDDPGCADLQTQLVLVVGILVEAGRGAPAQEPPPPPPPPEPTPPPPPEKQGVKRTRRRSILRAGPRRSHVVGLVATGGWGELPGGYPGAELRWSIASRKGLAVRVAGAFEGPGRVDVEPGGVRFYGARATVGICPEWPVGATKLGFCGLIGAGTTRSRSQGLPTNAQLRSPTFLVGAEGFVSIPLAGSVEAVVGMQALGIPYRPRFVYTELDGTRRTVFTPAAVALRGHGGLQLRFR